MWPFLLRTSKPTKEQITAFPSLSPSWRVFFSSFFGGGLHAELWALQEAELDCEITTVAFYSSPPRGSALFVQWLRCQGCQDAKMPVAGRECRQLSGLWCFWQRCLFSTAVSPRARLWPHTSRLLGVETNAGAQWVTASYNTTGIGSRS